MSILQIMAQPAVEALMQHLAGLQEASLSRTQLENRLSEFGAPAPSVLLDQLMDAHLVHHIGQRIGLSDFGQKAVLLLEALGGADIEDVYSRLRRLTGLPEIYELVREGMTTEFFKSLVDKPGFGRLYVCSPWINPSEKEAAMLKYATFQVEKFSGKRPEILVVTRPAAEQPDKTGECLRPFTDVGAKFYIHRRLHSKLYIREPGASGGIQMAMVGSENLTRGAHLELGIRINGDDRLVSRLIAYFHELTTYSVEMG